MSSTTVMSSCHPSHGFVPASPSPSPPPPRPVPVARRVTVHTAEPFRPAAIPSGTISPAAAPVAVAPAFSNYDVLLARSSVAGDDDSNDVVRFAAGNHVGNERFRVLLTMYRPRYLEAMAGQNLYERATIVKEVLDTVRRKCVPNGKFYEQGRSNEWNELPPAALEAVVRRALEREPREEEEEVQGQGRPSKRLRRRASHLSAVSLDSHEEGDASSSSSVGGAPRPFDVLCDADGRGLKRNSVHVGNNRFKILLELRKKSYRSSADDDGEGRKEKIAEELADAVLVDSKGRFLQECGAGFYQPLCREEAIACVRACLDGGRAAPVVAAPPPTAAEGRGTKNGRRRGRAGKKESELAKLKRRHQKKVVLGGIEHGRTTGSRRIVNEMAFFRPTTSLEAAPPTTFRALDAVRSS